MLGAIVVIDVIEDQPMVLKPQFLLSCKPDSTVLAGQCMYAAMIKVMTQTFPDMNQSVHFVIDCLIDCMEAYPRKYTPEFRGIRVPDGLEFHNELAIDGMTLRHCVEVSDTFDTQAVNCEFQGPEKHIAAFITAFMVRRLENVLRFDLRIRQKHQDNDWVGWAEIIRVDKILEEPAQEPAASPLQTITTPAASPTVVVPLGPPPTIEKASDDEPKKRTKRN
jgi:hypothetical protein